MSKLRWAVLFTLAKSWVLGISVPVGRLIRVFNLNAGLVYRYLEELKSDGIAEPAGRGMWRLRGNRKAQALASYILESRPESVYEYWASTVPEVYYYIAEPPSIEWLGFPSRVLVIVDDALRGKITPPDDYLVVYASLRGRRWRYDWGIGASRAQPEQALADLLSYDPNYPAEQYILNNLPLIDLDDVARRCTPEGLRRLATFLAFLRTATGRPVPASVDYLSLADPRIVEERLGEYVGVVYGNGVAEKRGI